MTLNRRGILLVLPAIVLFAAIFLAPMAGLVAESFKLFTPGRIGAVEGSPLTVFNYTELLNSSFLGFFLETFKIGIFATLAGLIFALPIAYFTARHMSPGWRALCVGFLITLMLLSVLVRTYAIELAFGSVGILTGLLSWLDISPTSRGYIECLVGVGLLHYIIPVSALTLLGTIQNVDARLVDAAQSLGASAWKAHLTITLPLSLPGILSAFLVSLTFSLSAFVIPMVLGKGRVLFLSNLIYNRFSEIANYPSGAAISIVMLIVSLGFVYFVSHLATARWEVTRR